MITAIEDLLDAHNGAISAVATVVVAVFTVVLAFVTARQARLTRKLAASTADAARAARDTAEITRQLAASTEIAAKAARDSAAIIPTLERAYLFVEVDPVCFSDLELELRFIELMPSRPPKGFAAAYQITNHGKTPGIVKAVTVILQYDADINRPAQFPPTPLSSGAIVIPGGATHLRPDVIPADPEANDPGGVVAYKLKTPLQEPLTSEQIARIGKGLYVLQFVAGVVYEDVFGNEHETRVCMRYNPQTHTLVEFGGEEFNHRT